MNPVRFRVYPENRSLYFDVNVWRDFDSLNKHGEHLYPHHPFNGKSVGFFSEQRNWRYDKAGRKRTSARCGEVNFFADCIGAGIVTHEMTHAVLSWSRRIGLDVQESDESSRSVDRTEERFCEALGECVRQFYVKAQEFGLY